VAVLTENLVLGKEHALDTAHELSRKSQSMCLFPKVQTYATTLSVKVRADLLLERGTVNVTGTDGDGHRLGDLVGLAGDVLVNGVGSVDTAALKEEGTDGTAGTLGGDEDNVDVLGGHNAGLFTSDCIRGRVDVSLTWSA
jgi:hypothetical protein